MSNRTLRMSLSALAAIAVLVLAGPARAGIWSSDYDPPAIGTATFDVPAPCLTGVIDGQHSQGEFTGCSIQILSNVATTPAVDFSSILPVPLCTLCTYEVIDQQFVGVNTGIIGAAMADDENNYWFQYVSTFHPVDGSSASVTNFVNFYATCGDGPCSETAFVADRVTFVLVSVSVPEPGSLGLILGALGAGWLARRRKPAA
jgi:hypothetical protein